MTKRLLLLFCFAISFSSYAQCDGNRYQSGIFTNYDITTDVLYGSNVDKDGVATDLTMDVYTPSGDTQTDRPVIIVIHGGYFLGGDKAEADVVPLCEDFAKMGYVVASINYRLGVPFTPPLQTPYGQAVVRAVQDVKAAIRWFRKNAAEGGNTYQIDPNKIFVGGDSAGGFAALHLAYMDESDIPAWLTFDATGMDGGLEGLSGNPGYSSDVTAIYSVSGALGDVSWIDANDTTPAVLTHGDNDAVVTIDSGTFILFGLLEVTEISGSNPIAAQMETIGLQHCYEINEGTGHVPYLGNGAVYDSTMYMISHFFAQFVCNTTYNCDYADLVAVEESVAGNQPGVYPNPVDAGMTIYLGKDYHQAAYTLHDSFGRIVSSALLNSNSIGLPQTAPGVYFLTIKDGDTIRQERILIN